MAAASPFGPLPTTTAVVMGRSSGVDLGELALEHLAGGVAGQLVDEDDVAGCLVAGEVLRDVRLDLVDGELRTVVEYDERPQPLSEPVVGHADRRGLADGVVGVEQLLDLAGEDVLAAGHDHVVVAAVDEQASRGVE